MKKLTTTKLYAKMQDAKALTARMKELKLTPDVAEYLAAEEARKGIHKDIASHVETYNVKVSDYKPLGLVERGNSWVKVTEVRDLMPIYPEFRKVLDKLIHTSKSYYTK